MRKFCEFILIAAALFIITTAFLTVDKHSSQICDYKEAFTQNFTLKS